ncbi:MAG TPA: 2-phosphosulfolactate phosphatase [Actinomycetota bacterium]|nr:2-phosphosulfolactate phosphatase [Actinomycetota bacterium]
MQFWDQHGFKTRFEWGPEVARRLAAASDVIVVVDVISSTTCITIGCEQGARIFPYRFKDDSAQTFAESLRASLAVHREAVDDAHPYSLSPATFLRARAGESIVLPSPNGATIALAAAEAGKPVLAGCLRNASAVARAARALGSTVTVIAAGERWFMTDDSLRPAFEDQAGAGAILASLEDRSPEAAGAVAVFMDARATLSDRLTSCSSGREVGARGFTTDVALAAELDVSETVPILQDGAFIAAPR